jgi:hypothetical protein
MLGKKNDSGVYNNRNNSLNSLCFNLRRSIMNIQTQPNAMPLFATRWDNLICLEPGLSSSDVVPAGTPISLRADLGFDGLLAPILVGQTFQIFYHAQRIEDNVTVPVLASPVTAVTLANLAHITVTAGPFATGPGGALPVAPGFAAGTYRIVGHLHFSNPAIDSVVTAFCDGLIIMVT